VSSFIYPKNLQLIYVTLEQQLKTSHEKYRLSKYKYHTKKRNGSNTTGISTISRLPNQISLHHQASTSEKAHRDKEASKETLQSTKQDGRLI
jgi:hypothetical protein